METTNYIIFWGYNPSSLDDVAQGSVGKAKGSITGHLTRDLGLQKASSLFLRQGLGFRV